MLKLKLPAKGTLVPTDETDPVSYYYHPLVGWLYRARIDLGLSLLEYPVDTILETGCASGLLMPTLKSVAKKYVGIDIVSSPNSPSVDSDGLVVHKMDVSKMSFDDESFDAVVAFSIFEHLPALGAALAEVARVLKPGGQLIAGFPQVSPFMNAWFDILGCPEAKKNHINQPGKIMETLAAIFRIETVRTLPPFLGPRTALYTCVKCVKIGKGS